MREIILKELPCVVGPNEMLEFGQKLCKGVEKVTYLANAKKQSASEYKAMEEKAAAEVAAAARVISTGIDYREVECQMLFDFEKGVVDTMRLDTCEIVDSRRMKDYERQTKLPLSEEE